MHRHRSSVSRTLGRLLGLTGILVTTYLPAAPARTSASPPAIRPADLRVEYRANPLGLDTRQPRFSWRLEAVDPDARGQRQTAYHLRVSDDPRALTRGTGLAWDSGIRRSDTCQFIVYAGRDLRSNQDLWWSVRVADQRGRWSDWTAPAHWTTGILDPAEWTAQWIGTGESFTRKPGWPPPDNTMPDPWFRKSFTLAGTPRRALLHVASIGYHELYVNGQRIGDAVLAPCATDHSKRARYVTYDLTAALHSGRNTLGLWLGTGWSIFPRYQTPDKPAAPIVLAQGLVELADGGTVRLATDESWKTHPSPNTLLGIWDFMHFGGERYDARLEQPDWGGPGLDDADWKPVVIHTPRLALSAEAVEPNRRVAVPSLRPVAITQPTNGVFRVDLGVNFAGWVAVDVSGQPGEVVSFQFSERPDQEMTHRLHSEYVIGPTGRGTFCNRFNYAVGRWMTIRGLREAPRPEAIRAWLLRTDYARTTEFECSNDLLNRIHATTLWTFENLSLGGYVVDCPQRERMGYGGDGHASTETGLDHYALGAFYTKWSEDWRDVQGKEASWGTTVSAGQAGSGQASADGNLPYTAPTYWGGGGPAWSGFCITLPWEVHRRTGDLRLLEVNFRTIERWLAFVETKAKGNLLRRYGGEWDFLGDWLWPGADGVNGDTRETLFFNNCYWVYNLETAARIADALSRREQALAWRARAQTVRRAIHREFYRPELHSYVNGLQAYLSAALLGDVPPLDQRAAVWDRLIDEIHVVRKGHFWGGITGGYFIVKNLIETDRPDLMYEMVAQEDYPGWGDQLKRGATTLWEDWEGRQSLLHSSYLHVGTWFIQGLAGIRPGADSNGYQRFTLQPAWWPGCPLTHVRATMDSPYGRIACGWRRAEGRWQLEVVVPPNTTADFTTPNFGPVKLTESGRTPDRIPGVLEHRRDGSRIHLRLSPGRYQFEAVPE